MLVIGIRFRLHAVNFALINDELSAFRKLDLKPI